MTEGPARKGWYLLYMNKNVGLPQWRLYLQRWSVNFWLTDLQMRVKGPGDGGGGWGAAWCWRGPPAGVYSQKFSWWNMSKPARPPKRSCKKKKVSTVTAWWIAKCKSDECGNAEHGLADHWLHMQTWFLKPPWSARLRCEQRFSCWPESVIERAADIDSFHRAWGVSWWTLQSWGWDLSNLHLGERMGGTANCLHADMNTHANPGYTTSPHAQEVRHHIQAIQLQESNREEILPSHWSVS